MACSCRAQLTAPLVVLLAFVALVAGCFSRNFAEGRYVESDRSGRWRAWERDGGGERMHFLRLNLVQFDDQAAGVVEVFTLADHDTFASQPTIQDRDPSPSYYFCTRVDFATSRDDQLVARFTDGLNRRWALRTRFEDEVLRGSLSRVRASGQPLMNTLDGDPTGPPDPDTLPYLLPEDRLYYSAPDSDRERWEAPLVLERERDDIDRQFLECVDYKLRDTLNLRLPPGLPPTAHVALVLTRPELARTSDSIESVAAQSFATATLEPVDLFDDGSRDVVLRLPPDGFLRSGVAVAAVLVYDDLPEPGSDRGDHRWGRLQGSGRQDEPLLAYGERVVVYSDEGVAADLVARDVDGDVLGPCGGDPASGAGCLFDDVPVAGWSVQGYRARGVTLADGARVEVLERLRGEAEQRLSLQAVDAVCQACYPTPGEDEEVRARCAECPAVLPVLHLF